MIVNYVDKGWEIFSHSSHGLLAGKIANEVLEKYRNDDWVSTLAAIIEHDDRQLDFEEKNYLTKLGVPQDFLLEKRKVSEIIKRSKRLLSQSKNKSSLVSLLIIHHLQFLHRDLAKRKKSLYNFLNKLEDQKEYFLKSNNLSSAELKSLYQIMIFSDRCSLILCQNEIPQKNRSLEINKSIDVQIYFIKELKNEALTIQPWIFKKDSFKVSAEYRLIEKTSFRDNEDFENSLNRSELKKRTWNFQRE